MQPPTISEKSVTPTRLDTDTTASAINDKASWQGPHRTISSTGDLHCPSMPSQMSDTTSSRPRLTRQRKLALLAVFSLGFFIDIWMFAAFFVFTGPISEDLNIRVEQQTWIITAYGVTFSSSLLLWGRVSDIYGPKRVFVNAFAALGTLSLITSFLPEKFSFFILRALAGLAGGGLVPASFRLITLVFDKHELNQAFTLFGASGSLANVSGILVAGVVQLIPGQGQMIAWRWFFRILSVIALPVTFVAWRLVPDEADNTDSDRVDNKLQRLDIPGALSMLVGVVLLTLGLTLGASFGFLTAGFFAPFILGLGLMVAFFFWEARRPAGYALLPSDTWRIPNFTILIIFSTVVFSWFSLNFLPFVELYVRARDQTYLQAALRILPEGVTASFCTVVLTIWPKLAAPNRFVIPVSASMALIGYVLFTLSTTQTGTDYWKFVFPGMVIGAGGMQATFTAVQLAVMMAVPPETGGVAGATIQMGFQVGNAVALSVQAGLLTIHPHGIENFDNVKISFYFVIGWLGVFILGFLALYKPSKTPQKDKEMAFVAH